MRSWLSAGSLALGLVLAACGVTETSAGLADPDVGAPCPAVHLAVALRRIAHDATPTLIRFDPALRRCRGVALADGNRTLLVVGGVSDGSELLGLSGAALRVRDQEVLWLVEEDGDAISVATATVAGMEVAVVMWSAFRSSSADRVALYDLDTGSQIASYDLSSSYRAVASTGQPDRLLLLHGAEGLEEKAVDLFATSLAGENLSVVLAPAGVGGLRRVAVAALSDAGAESTGAVAAQNGVLHWNEATRTMLGPRSCRWSVHGDNAPLGCTDFSAIGFARDGRWLTSCEADATTHLVWLDARDGCELAIDGVDLPDHRIADATWTGR